MTSERTQDTSLHRFDQTAGLIPAAAPVAHRCGPAVEISARCAVVSKGICLWN
jgi:hypothetical protein